jgi:hypothetical protein
MKSWKYILTAMVIIGTIGSQTALASDTQVDQTKSATDNVDQLIQIKDDSSVSGPTKVKKELGARLIVIKDVLKLSTDEIAKLQDKLKKLPKFTDKSQEKILKTEYQKSLDDFSAYYDDKFRVLSDIKTNNDAKTLAEELKNYRDTIYNPEIKKIANFTILFYDADVVKTGKTRLNKIIVDVSKLEKLGYLKSGVFSDKFKKAQALLDDADKLEQEAADIILASKTIEDTTQKDVTAQQTIDVTKVVEEPKDPGDLTSKSLQNVKDTYDIFLQIGKDIKKYLGLK